MSGPLPAGELCHALALISRAEWLLRQAGPPVRRRAVRIIIPNLAGLQRLRRVGIEERSAMEKGAHRWWAPLVQSSTDGPESYPD